MYFRLLLIGYFEGIDSERGIAWRAADSLGLRQFLRVGLDEMAAGSLDDLAHKQPNEGSIHQGRNVTSQIHLHHGLLGGNR